MSDLEGALAMLKTEYEGRQRELVYAERMVGAKRDELERAVAARDLLRKKMQSALAGMEALGGTTPPVPEQIICILCAQPIGEKFGHNPAPLADDGRCCGECNNNLVIPARLNLASDWGWTTKKKKGKEGA